MSEKRSFTLDAMRGVCALAIVTSHLGLMLPPERMQYSYLGVDFFFMLSGFVLARAYEPKLKQALSPWRFMELRLIRLYPLFFFGLSLGLAYAICQMLGGGRNAPEPVQAVLAYAQGLLMLPDIVSHKYLFPLNGPSWTLFLEILVNIVFAFVLFRLRSALLVLLSIASAAFYLWHHARLGSGNVGWAWSTFPIGVARAFFAFPLGLVLGRAVDAKRARISRLAILPVLLLAFVLFIGPPARFDLLFDAVAIFVVLPAIVWLGAMLQPPKSVRGFCETAGDISYPLFVLHYPLMRGTFALLVQRELLPGWMAVVFFVPAMIGFAWLVFHRLDVPVRRWLSAWSKVRPTAMPVRP